jgi:hypothetical protein
MADATIVIAETNASVVVTSNTSATISVTETTANITTSNVGIQGATGATGAGYSGVTSTSNLTIGTGLKTFTLVSGNSGAFVTGQRIRAIHSDTPTYWMEGYANYIGGGTLIITVDLTAGSGTHNLWNFAIAGQVGATGATGATGSSGVISVTAPITNSGTSTSAQLGIDQTALSITPSQVSGTAVITTDSRLSNARTPTAHASTHGSAGSDPVTIAASQVSGTAVTQADTGTVTSTMIADGTILDADINASAGIAATKISGTAAVLGSANSFTVGGQQITTNLIGVIPLVIQSIGSQTADCFKVNGTTGSFQITSSGALRSNINVGNSFGGGTSASTILNITTASATNVGLKILGSASQSANLQQWQNSSSTTLTAITSAGTINFASGNTASTATAGAITPPALVTGYITMQVAGTTVKVPYYSN